MGFSVTPLINRNNRKTKSGLHQIQVRVTINRKSKYFSLDQRINPKFWSGKPDKWVKESHPNSFEINKLIQDQVAAINSHIYRLKAFGHSIHLSSIDDFMRMTGNKQLFNDYIENYLRTEKFNNLNTIKKYKTFQKHLNSFNKEILFRDLCEDLFLRFVEFLKGKGHTGTTVKKYFDAFKKITRKAVKEGHMDRDPFYLVDLGIKLSKPRRSYLEIDEILQLKNCSVPLDRPDLEDTRNHWLFCFYAAFYYSDLKKLKWSDLVSSDQGYFIRAGRYKNDQSYLAPIYKFPHAISLLSEQKGKHSEFIFPNLISEPKYNGKLKELAAAAGIDKKLNNKMARHSAVQFWEAQGLETQFTAKIVGHTKESTTKSYYELSLREMGDRVDKIDISSLGL